MLEFHEISWNKSTRKIVRDIWKMQKDELGFAKCEKNIRKKGYKVRLYFGITFAYYLIRKRKMLNYSIHKLVII
jgi:hypothetical protein